MDEIKVITVYGNIYIVLFKEKDEYDTTFETVRAFTDMYASERFCKKVDGKTFIETLDSEDIPYGRYGGDNKNVKRKYNSKTIN